MVNNGISFSYILQQLQYLGPSLLVFVFAGFMALYYIDRATNASILTLIGVAISVVTMIGFALLQAYLISNRAQLGDQRQFIMQAAGVASSVFRAVGLGFLVMAIFTGRNVPPSEDRYLKEDNE